MAPDPASPRWLLASYDPVSLFSLRMTHATSKGGKTLVVPTPYAVRMALIDACFRCYPAGDAPQRARVTFELIKRRRISVRPPEDCVVQNTFIKVLDQSRDPSGGPFRNTIVYREFVFYRGRMEVAIWGAGLNSNDEADLARLFAHINGFGKRGGFWQYRDATMLDGELPCGFTVPRHEAGFAQASSYGLTHALDDFGEELCAAKDGFDRISTYGMGSVRLGEHRVLVPTAIPYRRHSAGRNFTWYRHGAGR